MHRIGWLAAALALVLAAPAAGAELSDPSPAIGQFIVLKTSVSTKSGSEIFNPAVYVDWDGGSCPADAAAARTAAKGHFRRGMGFAGQSDGFFTDTLPVSARLLVETERQTVCFYDSAGQLADQTVVKGTPRLPPQTENGPAKRWGMGNSPFTAKASLSWLTIYLTGLHATKYGLAAGIYNCDGKRFFLNASKVHLDSGGHFSYNALVSPDNSNNYDAPIPLKFHGRALLKLSGTIGIGKQELKLPITDPTGDVDGNWTKGHWGHPVITVKGSFSAPGFRAHPGTPLCSTAIHYLLNVSPMDGGDVSVMVGQGSARMATDPNSPNQGGGEDAGVGQPVPPDTAPADTQG